MESMIGLVNSTHEYRKKATPNNKELSILNGSDSKHLLFLSPTKFF